MRGPAALRDGLLETGVVLLVAGVVAGGAICRVGSNRHIKLVIQCIRVIQVVLGGRQLGAVMAGVVVASVHVTSDGSVFSGQGKGFTEFV